MGTGDLGDGSSQRGPGAEPQWGSGGDRSPQKPDMHIQFAVDKRIFVMCS